MNLRQKPTVFPWDFLPFAFEKLGILKLKRNLRLMGGGRRLKRNPDNFVQLN